MNREYHRSVRWTAWALGCVLGAAATAPAWAQARPQAERDATASPKPTAHAQRTLIARGDPPDLFLLYTGDVLGYVDPCG
jgi:hypothetical protein